jgi:hypothetical protein
MNCQNVLVCRTDTRGAPVNNYHRYTYKDNYNHGFIKQMSGAPSIRYDFSELQILQTSVRDGIIALKGLMDELRRNMDTEKHTINTFCQGMQEAMAKTHAAMIMEVQRQFESKERIYRSQLLVLG